MKTLSLLSSLLSIATGAALPQSPSSSIPATGDNGVTGGIFGAGAQMDLSKTPGGLSGLLPKTGGSGAPTTPAGSSDPTKSPGWSPLSGAMSALGDRLGSTPITSIGGVFGGAGSEAVPNNLTDEQWANPGTGPYPAKWQTDPSLPEKTIYAPIIAPPAHIKMPVIVWGEGGCFKTGIFYAPFLLEIASHGYVILANGLPGSKPPKTVGELAKLSTAGQTKVSDLAESIVWVIQGKGAKYGNLDATNIIAAGQSCGGTEALSIAYHNEKVKLTVLVNSGVLNGDARPLLKEFKYPVAIFNGGPKDIAFKNGELDYDALPKGLPAFKANLDTGHGGTLFAMNGGKFGKAVTAFLEWQFRGDAKSKAICLDPIAPGSLFSDKWNVTAKNWG